MILTRLKLTNLRAIEVAEFRFQPGFNLIVGVNGVGKTSVLNAVSVCLSAIVRHTNKLRNPVESFTANDIRVRAEALTVECEVQIRDSTYSYLVHKPRETSVPQRKKSGSARDQVHETPERAEFVGEPPTLATGKEPEGRPLGVLFSTRRAVPSDRRPLKSAAAGSISAAYSEAYGNRELRLAEFAAWIRAQQILRVEKPSSQRILNAFDQAVSRFLSEYSNLRASNDKRARLLIDHGGYTLELKQLSDGERGTLAMVLDLTRRLAQANPHLVDPAGSAEAIVLIDEIELHLHPKWQREIVGNLTSAFPKCQFIATSHSPQVVGEIDHSRIQIMGEDPIYSPNHSFGVDSSRILEEIMGAVPRTESVQHLLTRISRVISDEKYEDARRLLSELVGQIGPEDPEVTRIETLLDFMEEK